MIYTVVTCDKCQKQMAFGYIAEKLAIKLARGAGWTVGKQWTCPNCRRKRKGKENER